MAADLPHDGRHRERHEVGTGVDVEPDDGVDQTDPRHLNQVLAGLAAAVETAGDVIGQRHAALHDPIALATELRRIRFQFAQLPKQIRNVGVLRVRP